MAPPKADKADAKSTVATGEDTLEAKPKPRPFEEAKAKGAAGPVELDPETREPKYGGDYAKELAAGAPLNSFALEPPSSPNP